MPTAMTAPMSGRRCRPSSREVAADEVRPERARRVHRGAGDRAAPQAGERDVAAHTRAHR